MAHSKSEWAGGGGQRVSLFLAVGHLGFSISVPIAIFLSSQTQKATLPNDAQAVAET